MATTNVTLIFAHSNCMEWECKFSGTKVRWPITFPTGDGYYEVPMLRCLDSFRPLVELIGEMIVEETP